MPRQRKFRDSDDSKLREDTAETAFRTLQEAIGERPKTVPGSEPAEKNAAAVERGRKGGKKGGKARAAALSPRRLTASAKKAARKRWAKPRSE
ncbi:MAG: histone H1 [Deltaproteobacteria bacterium]|nr:histone H1 [Deltaproteobacteria bacterium]